MEIVNCKLNHLRNPVGFQLDETVFSWDVTGASGKKQTQARILVSAGNRVAADTGWAVLNSLAAPVPMNLTPRTRYTWTVSVRTDAGEEAVSAENFFETSKIDEPWAAQWISCSGNGSRHPVFSRRIAPKKPVASARLYICGLGLYEAAWNGEKIGSEYLTPYCNNYNRWVQYQTYDITQALQSPGTLSVTLGNGWYKGRFGFPDDMEQVFGSEWKLLAEVRMVYTDGTQEAVGTDETWTAAPSSILDSGIYDGEIRDDSLPCSASLDVTLAEPPKGDLFARRSLRVTAHERFPVKQLIHTPAGETVLDIGQNIAGIFQLHVRERAGTKIRLQFGELLQNGNFFRDNLRTAKAEYIYTSDGLEKVIEPKFTFYGFRYVKIEGAENFTPEDFTAVALYSDLEMHGTLETGSPLVNKLIENTRWGMKSNFLDVPTDCPQRDERMGWTGDAQVFSPSALYFSDAYGFYAKYLYDLAQEQAEHGGMVPNVIPNAMRNLGTSAAWGDAAAIIPWNVYLFTGDTGILRSQYDSMKAWVDYITAVDGDSHHWREVFHFGDWLALDSFYSGFDALRGGTDTGLIADAYYRKSVRIVADTARILGKTEDAAYYDALTDRILAGIREEYYSPAGRCCSNTQTAALLTLSEGLSDPLRAKKDLDTLMDRCGGQLRTGFVGTPLLCNVLSDCGMETRAYDLLLNEEYPGWLYEVKLGATTIWERWNSLNPDGSISSTGMNSLNHYAYGSIVEWIFRHAAGIKPLEPGFRKAEIKPLPDFRLRSLRCEFRGYEIEWAYSDPHHISLSVTVPFDYEAVLTLPNVPSQSLSAGKYHFTLTTGADQ